MPIKKVSEKSVSITPSLQKLFVIAVGLFFGLQLATTVYFTATVPADPAWQFLLYQASVTLIPLYFFGLAWWFVGAFGTLLNRLFKSVLIAATGGFVLAFAMTLGSMFPVIILRSGYNIYKWQFILCMLVAGVVLAYTAILVGLKTKRIRRA